MMLWVAKLFISEVSENFFKSYTLKTSHSVFKCLQKVWCNNKRIENKTNAKHVSSLEFFYLIKDTETQLICKVLEENRKNLTAQLNNSENNIAVYLKENGDMTVIQKMLSECIELERKVI